MAAEKKSFILYADIIHTVKKLPKDKAGELFLTILQYVNDEDPSVNDVLVDLVFEPIKQQLKRDLKHWEGVKVTRSEAGKLGGLKSGETRRKKSLEANEANASNAKQNEANEAVNVNVNVIHKESIKKKPSVFTPPTLEDVKEYFKANSYSAASAEKAFRYYNDADWVDSKGNRVKNWKQKMQGVWFKEENKTEIQIKPIHHHILPAN